MTSPSVIQSIFLKKVFFIIFKELKKFNNIVYRL